jgi:hypothetical protein
MAPWSKYQKAWFLIAGRLAAWMREQRGVGQCHSVRRRAFPTLLFSVSLEEVRLRREHPRFFLDGVGESSACECPSVEIAFQGGWCCRVNRVGIRYVEEAPPLLCTTWGEQSRILSPDGAKLGTH